MIDWLRSVALPPELDPFLDDALSGDEPQVYLHAADVLSALDHVELDDLRDHIAAIFDQEI